MNQWMALKIHGDMNTRRPYTDDEEWEFVALYAT